MANYKRVESFIIINLNVHIFNCPEEYIGKSGRTFGDRLKEHLMAQSLIHHHSNSTGHPVSPECFTIVDRGSLGTLRWLCTSVQMTLQLTGTWESINSHTYATRFYKTHLHSSSNNPALPPLHGPNPLLQQLWGAHATSFLTPPFQWHHLW